MPAKARHGIIAGIFNLFRSDLAVTIAIVFLELAIVALLVFIVDISVGMFFGITGEFRDDANYISEPAWLDASEPDAPDSSCRSALSPEDQETYDKLEYMCRTMSPGCVIRATSIPELIDIYKAVLFDNPDIFWASNKFLAIPILPSMSSVAFIPQYNEDSFPDAQEKHAMYMADVEQAASDIQDIESDTPEANRDIEMALDAMDEVCARLSFGRNEEDQTVKAFFGEEAGEAVCACYSKSFSLLCSALNIECHVICGGTDKSDGITHDWNMIRIGDDIFYVDTTWGGYRR